MSHKEYDTNPIPIYFMTKLVLKYVTKINISVFDKIKHLSVTNK